MDDVSYLQYTEEEKLSHLEYWSEHAKNEMKAFQASMKKVAQSFLSYICCCDGLLRTKSQLTEVVLKGNPTFSDVDMVFLKIDNDTQCHDGKFYICKCCKSALRKGSYQYHFLLIFFYLSSFSLV